MGVHRSGHAPLGRGSSCSHDVRGPSSAEQSESPLATTQDNAAPPSLSLPPAEASRALRLTACDYHGVPGAGSKA